VYLARVLKYLKYKSTMGIWKPKEEKTLFDKEAILGGPLVAKCRSKVSQSHYYWCTATLAGFEWLKNYLQSFIL
jgi:hypothetical protein